MADDIFVNHYEILGIKPDSTYEQIKKRYNALVLKYQPDGSDSSDTGISFSEVDDAWKVLRDPLRRKAFDEKMKKRQKGQPNLLFGEFTVMDMQYDEPTDRYTHPCSCGGQYSFPAEDVKDFTSCLRKCNACPRLIYVDFQA